MIQKILHCADIHIKNKLSTHSEIIDVFSDFIKKAKMESPDRIVIVGDLFDNYIEVNNEAKIIAGDFLNKLSEIAPIRITQGNHDIRKSSINRTDSILTVVNLINNPNIIYYKETNFYEDENVIFAVWHHIDKESPWVKIPHDRKNDKIYIDLFHDPINGCVSEIRRKIDSKNGINLSDFKGDFAFLGDIHLYQEYTKDDKIFSVYPSSVWETKYSEGDGDFHGFVIWDIINRKLNKIKVENKYSHHNIKIDINFNYSNPILDINKDNLTEFSRLKIIWSDYESKILAKPTVEVSPGSRAKLAWSLDSARSFARRLPTSAFTC
jgi:DNA repair exonuclease SbcCD nuclease subunit